MSNDASHEEVIDVVELGQLGGLEDLFCGAGFHGIDPAVAVGRIGVAMRPFRETHSPESNS